MKKVVVYGLLLVVGFLFLRWLWSALFSLPKKSRLQIAPTATPTPSTVQNRSKDGQAQARLTVAVFKDKDENKSRGFGEEGLDWQVHYRIGTGPEQTVYTKADQKCFPTIFNWFYGGCSQDIPVPAGEWVKVWIEPKPGWVLTKGEDLIVSGEGKNLVALGVDKPPPGVLVKKKASIKCQSLDVNYLPVINDKIKLEVKIQASGQPQEYRLVVDDQDLGWQSSSRWEVETQKGRVHTLKAYVRDNQGKVDGGHDDCTRQVGSNIAKQPETGTPTWVLAASLVILFGFGFKIAYQKLR